MFVTLLTCEMDPQLYPAFTFEMLLDMARSMVWFGIKSCYVVVVMFATGCAC